MSSPEEKIISISVPRPLSHAFTYRVPKEFESRIHRGAWVKVPFGKSKVVGYVLSSPKLLSDLPKGVEENKLRWVEEVSPEGFSIPESVLSLCEWASKYYQSPLGEVLASAAPSSVLGAKRSGEGRKKKASTQESMEGVENKRKPRELTLNEEQKNAVEGILKADPALPVLLHGVTGSGKTEVYIELAKDALSQGKRVLLLVPEIALTSQLHQRFEEGLGQKVEVIHSALSDLSRQEKWLEIREGKVNVVIGARSSVFAPIPDLGLIVVDEEHEPAYKQEDRARYHARDLAIVRAKLEKSRIILGSATPSLETIERVREGRFNAFYLKNRAREALPPTIEILDLKELPLVPGTQAPLTEQALEEIRKTLSKGEQVMIFLNRRGFAAFMLCEDCGEVNGCPECSISLTVHRKKRVLRCHVCGYQESLPHSCPKCLGTTLSEKGAGTESLEMDLPALLPEARITRLDRDQVTSGSRLESILQSFRKNETNVLLGTQMLVKGHDFPGVTLVVVVMADGLFRAPDFRSNERAYQVLMQVSGRSGRAEKPGRVLIQTYSPEQAVFLALQSDEKANQFLEEEKENRKALQYPPYCRMARLRVENKNPQLAERLARALTKELEAFPSIEILGPSQAYLERAKGLTRWDVMIKSMTINSLTAALARARIWGEEEKIPLVIDVDPQGLG